jgi:prolyl oligopeptidase
MAETDCRPTLAAPDDDPYLWLEDIDAAAALAWVADQNARTLARSAGPQVDADRDALAAIFDRPDNIPVITRRGRHVYNFWRYAAQVRGLWRRTTLDSFRTAAPDWDAVLDLDALAEAEGEDWVWQGATVLPETHDRAILRLSRGGGDAVVLREFDLAACRFVAGGFALPEAKGGVAWIDRDTLLLLSSALGQGMATASGYARTVRLWRRGEDALAAPVLLAIAPDSMSAGGGYDRENRQITFYERTDFINGTLWLAPWQDGAVGAQVRVDLPSDAWYSWHRGWLALRPRSDWTVGGVTYPAGAVLAMARDACLAGDRTFATLFTPAERRVCTGFFWAAGRLIVDVLDDLAPRHLCFTPAAEGWRGTELAGLPELGVVHVWRLDEDEDDSDGSLLVTAQDPLTPARLLLTAPDLAAPAVLKTAPAAFDPAGLVVTRHEAVSADGTRIPYFQTGPAALSGEAPVHLYGYGGFNVSEMPVYRSAIGKLWLERGGTAVTACLRGGGEFGPAWHEAGRRAGKARSHDDFAAVAADLVARGVTRADRIAAEGGSNGGILITNMLARYPERFGALFSTIPLVDMRRFNKLLAGASWVAEYGNPDDPADWAFLQHISAYHTVTDRRGPPILLATTRRDDRVHPGHARKMAAKLQALGHDAMFYELEAGGHSYGKSARDRAHFIALGYAFLRQAIGWAPVH